MRPQINDGLDVHVFHRDALDNPEHWDSPWLVQFSDGSVDGYDTEEAACLFQRRWRRANGMNPTTGEKITAAAPRETLDQMFNDGLGGTTND